MEFLKNFFSFSARGVNEFFKSDVRFLSLDEWQTEYNRYKTLVKLDFFRQFRLMKAFRTWRKTVRRQKFSGASRSLQEKSCIFGNKYMRGCYIKTRNNLAHLCVMGITDISAKTTKHINDFYSQQTSQIAKFQENFMEFRAMMLRQVLDAAKATFTEEGFSYEDYSNEMAALNFARGVGGGGGGKPHHSSTLSGISQIRSAPRVKKLTFIEQANKRQCCLKIISFVKLIDFMIRRTLHQIIYNSIVAIQKPMDERSRKDLAEDMSDDSTEGPGSVSRSDQMSKSNQKGGGKEGEQEQIIPVFSLTIGVGDEQIKYTPDVSVFENTFQEYLNRLNETIVNIPLLLHDKSFNPFTQPILYGKLENYR